MVPLSGNSTMRLSDCADGMAGIVSAINGTCRATARLLEMGMIPGETVRVIRGGCPVILQVGETRLCVRANHLVDITVEPFHAVSTPVDEYIEFQDAPLFATGDQ